MFPSPTTIFFSKTTYLILDLRLNNWSGKKGGPVPLSGPQPLLPYLLATAGKAARVPGGGHLILVGLLRLLSSIVSGCAAAARQVCDVM